MCLRRIKVGIREALDRIDALTRRITGRSVEEIDLTEKARAKFASDRRPKEPKKWWQFPVRLIKTSRGGVNMPRYQPCPYGHGWKKRVEKTAGGAYYLCNRCPGKFFVRYPRAIMIR